MEGASSSSSIRPLALSDEHLSSGSVTGAPATGRKPLRALSMGSSSGAAAVGGEGGAGASPGDKEEVGAVNKIHQIVMSKRSIAR